MKNTDVFYVGMGARVFTIRWYAENNWGYRRLGPMRFAYDFGHVSLVFENYGPTKRKS